MSSTGKMHLARFVWLAGSLALLAEGCFGCDGCGGAGDAGARDATPTCADGETMCAGTSVVTCTGGGWGLPETCPPGEWCDDAVGACAPGPACVPGALSCESGDVVQCLDDGSGTVLVEDCGPGATCEIGACLALCERAALFHESIGCEYFALDTNNVSSDDPLAFEVVVANPHPALSADVTIEARAGAGSPWMGVAGDVVAAGGARVFGLADLHVEGTALAPGLAYRIRSTLPVLAYQFNSKDPASVSSGATLLLATASLGQSYYVISLPTSVGDDAALAFGAEVHHSGFAVVGTADGTNVVVSPRTSTLAGAGIPAMAAGDSWATVLNAGDVLQIEGAAVGDDVTGSVVSADQPVALFAYHECATIQPGTCDHIEEQLVPVAMLGVPGGGTEYACVRAYGEAEAHVWRLLATEDATTITFVYDAGTSGLPAPSGSTIGLNAGEWLELIVDGPASPGPTPTSENLGDFVVTSDRPIHVAEIAYDEPSLALLVPAARAPDAFLFQSPPWFDSHVTLARADDAPYPVIDGAPAGAGLWGPLVTGYEAHRRSLPSGAHLIEAGASTRFYDPSLAIYLGGRLGTAGYLFLANRGPRCEASGDDIVCW